MTRAVPPFRADHVGSLLRPEAIKEARARRAAGEIGADELKAVEDREIEAVIRRQEDIGLKAATDGEFRRALMHADKLGKLIQWRIRELTGIHPDKMPAELRRRFMQSGDLRILYEEIHRDKLSDKLWKRVMRNSRYEDGDWLVVDKQFAELYMSALAGLLARELQVSPLTNEEPCSGVNLRYLVGDVASPV
jgi:hypothetical protein